MPSTTTPHPTQREIEPHPSPPQDPKTHKPSYAPNPSTSVPLSPTRQAIQTHILNLYSGAASESDMAVYAEQAVYDDPLSYCDTRYKIAGQWYGIPNLFARSETLATEVVVNSEDELVWKQRQRYTLAGVHVSKTVDSLVSLRLEHQNAGEKVVYHKDMWDEEDYDHGGFGAWIKKVNGDLLTHITKPPESI
ncbi:uncharacterized protein BO97DRAFT_402042 [Aspergillus homomorphus CBS 101889]|uniref:SnoaL-like domain-containing protein n=1 Tax=Aspergillus homomorphus (strain CBS 101889) TaxID=1450537 RepID=A0A395ICD2_ASPHC|nr:hypothetical protein BO97DRAFT_402042 [Aspergillus homomorphus CBS 101889]RAL17459.1 hypothetical protein BO97DRAFT_402042 [Aspergillus homomorphus CBS 101889]